MHVRTSSGKSFDTDGETSLLDAAHRAGIAWPYSCRTGRCSTCRGLVRSGETRAMNEEIGLTKAEREEGWILTCVRACRSNLRLDIEDVDAALQAPRTSACRIDAIERLSSDVVRVVLRFPPGAAQAYRPGQYIDVIGHGGVRRSYSIANAPSPQNRIELHIRAVEGGAMSRYWFGEAKVNDLLRMNGPLGTFFLRDVTDRRLVLLATGTGIAPIKAMLEGLAERSESEPAGLPREIWVFWGGRREQDLYWRPPDTLPLRFVPVLSRADARWKGARGHVQDAAIGLVDGWSDAVVYACGNDAMIRSAQQALTASGLAPGAFHSDAFVCSAQA